MLKPLSKPVKEELMTTKPKLATTLKLTPKQIKFEQNKLVKIPDAMYHNNKATSDFYSSTQVKGILKRELGREMTGALDFGVKLHADIESKLLGRPALHGDSLKGADAKKFASCINSFDTVMERYTDFTHLEYALLMTYETIQKASVPKYMQPFRDWVVKHKINIKIKPDWLKIDEEKKTFRIVDWKSTSSDSLNCIVKDTTNYGYVFSAFFYTLPLLCLGYTLEKYELVFLVKKYTQMSVVIVELDLAGANCKASMDYYLNINFTSMREEIYEPSKKLVPIEFKL